MARSTEDAGTATADWRALAACRPFDSAIFFPDRTAYRNNAVAGAKAVCRRCPVREECLEAAMEGGEKVGIWGGLTPVERANLRRRERRARAARPAASPEGAEWFRADPVT
ncbi:WhiB family transcriptional regulator [Actinomadura sp. DC4]|uniref:WhiB family transcriptional regulator n=1 Tax=Actinomadura sp. DC4 TaxID=3055069 RepID=UPI0025B0E950|nr:WhiB family transcriptional regulator [Actinomadura sp. DC4]MDN3358244.1 WhiB family transcriptional regulator [Actinomadura sp. DC4]